MTIITDRPGLLADPMHGLVAQRPAPTEHAPMPDRPPIERYVLATVDVPGGQVFAGLAYFPGDALNDLRGRFADHIERILGDVKRNAIPLSVDLAGAISFAIETTTLKDWPDRPFWLEVWNEHEELTQTYAPWGRPRNHRQPDRACDDPTCPGFGHGCQITSGR